MVAQFCNLALFLAQIAPPASSTTLPDTWIGAGATYTGGAKAGYATYAKLVSASQQAYSYSTYEVSKVAGKWTTTTDTGGAFVVRSWTHRAVGSFYILGFGTAGVAMNTNALLSLSGGGVAVWRIRASTWTVQGSVRIQKVGSASTNVYGLGFGRAFQKGL